MIVVLKPSKTITIIDTSILYLIIYLRCVKNYTSSMSSFNYKSLHRNPNFLQYFESEFRREIGNLLRIDNNSTYNNMIFVRDTPIAHNWRKLSITNSYKSNRKPMTEFDPGVHNFFWNKLMPRLGLELGIKIIYCEPLEADDIVYLIVQKLRDIYPETKINIITNDRDYLQIADHKTSVYKTNGRLLESTLGDSLFDRAIKILSGDTSDYIKPIYRGCGELTAYKLLKKLYLPKNYQESVLAEKELVDKQLLGEMFQQDLLNTSNLGERIFMLLTKDRREKGNDTPKTIANNLEINARLIDLSRIPEKYKEDLFNKYIFSEKYGSI